MCAARAVLYTIGLLSGGVKSVCARVLCTSEVIDLFLDYKKAGAKKEKRKDSE